MLLFFQRALLGATTFVLLAAAGLAGWAATGPQPTARAAAALQSSQTVTVEQQANWIVFQPASRQPTIGFIFYPGGRVPAEAYAAPLAALAEQGVLVALARMPFNLAVFDSNRAAEAIAVYPEIEAWAIGGHSLGGVMAAAFADANPDVIQGLVLWAAYPAEANDLARRPDLAVLSLYGTLDGLAAPEQILASASLLPPSAEFIALKGGNHSQFGDYGFQAGDNPAAISPELQQAQIIEATGSFLSTLLESE